MNTSLTDEAQNGIAQASIGWIGAGKMGAPMIRNLLPCWSELFAGMCANLKPVDSAGWLTLHQIQLR